MKHLPSYLVFVSSILILICIHLLYFSLVYPPTVPDAPTNCATTAIYSHEYSRLLFINSTWNTVEVSHVECCNACLNFTRKAGLFFNSCFLS